MVDSKQKGTRAELVARDTLRELTGLSWERIPLSGALNSTHKLKGDIYIPECNNIFCVEVKHYAEDQVSTKLITGKNPILLDWWQQTLRQADSVNKEPLLLFKHDRSKWFVAFIGTNYNLNYKYIEYNYISFQPPIIIAKLDDWLKNEEIQWVKTL